MPPAHFPQTVSASELCQTLSQVPRKFFTFPIFSDFVSNNHFIRRREVTIYKNLVNSVVAAYPKFLSILLFIQKSDSNVIFQINQKKKWSKYNYYIRYDHFVKVNTAIVRSLFIKIDGSKIYSRSTHPYTFTNQIRSTVKN